jgi:pimeloyl-ACP methyl ester carboxylesterase
MSERRKMEFNVAGTQVVGYTYRPGAPSGQLPAIVMAHGFSGTQQGSLARTARDFADAGFLVLTFDYRNFGESDGAPRQVINIARQLADWAAAVAVVRGLDNVDPGRVALWGSSLSGAHVVYVAVKDPRIAAIVAQVPFNGFPAKVERRSVPESLALLWLALKDRARAWLGLPPLYVPVVGRPGERAVITTDRAETIIASLQGSHWENRVAPRVILDMVLGYRPGTVAHRVTVPLLVCAAELDVHTPPDLARLIAERAPRGEVLRYSCTHFDFYDDPIRGNIVADQIEFLKKVLIET